MWTLTTTKTTNKIEIEELEVDSNNHQKPQTIKVEIEDPWMWTLTTTKTTRWRLRSWMWTITTTETTTTIQQEHNPTTQQDLPSQTSNRKKKTQNLAIEELDEEQLQHNMMDAKARHTNKTIILKTIYIYSTTQKMQKRKTLYPTCNMTLAVHTEHAPVCQEERCCFPRSLSIRQTIITEHLCVNKSIHGICMGLCTGTWLITTPYY